MFKTHREVGPKKSIDNLPTLQPQKKNGLQKLNSNNGIFGNFSKLKSSLHEGITTITKSLKININKESTSEKFNKKGVSRSFSSNRKINHTEKSETQLPIQTEEKWGQPGFFTRSGKNDY